MIKANEAYHNVVTHQTRPPVKSIVTLSEIIRVASSLGYEKVTIFILSKDESKIKAKLKQHGYLVNTTYIKSLPNEVMLEINWVTSKFIGETIKEIDNE